MTKPDENGWRPIETAPKDGTYVLVFSNEDGVDKAYCDEGFWFRMATAEYGNEFWEIENPTHWQRLPPPPKPPVTP